MGSTCRSSSAPAGMAPSTSTSVGIRYVSATTSQWTPWLGTPRCVSYASYRSVGDADASAYNDTVRVSSCDTLDGPGECTSPSSTSTTTTLCSCD